MTLGGTERRLGEVLSRMIDSTYKMYYVAYVPEFIYTFDLPGGGEIQPRMPTWNGTDEELTSLICTYSANEKKLHLHC